MIFGGLEVIAGGYLIHRHYKHKNEKKRQEDEAEARRHNTFPGARPAGHSHHHHSGPQQRPPQCQQPVLPPQKYACYGTPVTRPHNQHQYHHHQQIPAQPRPQPPRHAQTFNIPRRPVPERKPEIIIQPSLQRTDSFATLSRMPIANGSRPQDVGEETSPVHPTRLHTTGLQPAPAHGIYGNVGYSVSTPAFGATPTSPGLTYTMATGPQAQAMQTVDDNWETYGHPGNRYSYAPTVSTQLGERDPPPPYAP